MLAWFSGCLIRAVPTSDGILHWKDIEAAIRPASAHCAPTTLIEIENTHNMAGGAVYPLDVVEEFRRTHTTAELRCTWTALASSTLLAI